MNYIKLKEKSLSELFLIKKYIEGRISNSDMGSILETLSTEQRGRYAEYRVEVIKEIEARL